MAVHHSAANHCQIHVKVGDSIQEFGASKYLPVDASLRAPSRSLHPQHVPLARGHLPGLAPRPAELGLNREGALKFVLDIQVLLHHLGPFLLQMSFERAEFSAGRCATQANPLLPEKPELQARQKSGPEGSTDANWAACAVSQAASEILQSGYRGYCDLNTLFLIIGLVDSI